MADIQLKRVAKEYPNGYKAIHDVDLQIDDGEFLVLVGPSGCGKSTLLRMIAGLEEVTDGDVFIGNNDVTDAQPRERNIAMVFQSYALYPHMTVAKNIGYPLKLAKMSSAEIEERVAVAAETLQLTEVLDRKPGQLSGGQRQRVAMGRAIVRKPAAFLMDEPLSNLDAKLRVQMRAEIARLQRKFGTTTVYVTHDQVEAMTMGHRVAVLNGGVIVQCDTPRRLYNRPANLFVAAFIGSPAMNMLSGEIVRRDNRLAVVTGDMELPLDPQDWSEDVVDGLKVVVGLRPEALRIDPIVADGPTITASVDFVEELGSELMVHATAAIASDIAEALATIEAANDGRSAASTGSNCVAKLPPQTDIAPGDELTLHVDSTQVHLFLPSGPSLRVDDADTKHTT